MSTTLAIERMAVISPRFKGRVTGVLKRWNEQAQATGGTRPQRPGIRDSVFRVWR
jgi:hypothetical protein